MWLIYLYLRDESIEVSEKRTEEILPIQSKSRNGWLKGLAVVDKHLINEYNYKQIALFSI